MLFPDLDAGALRLQRALRRGQRRHHRGARHRRARAAVARELWRDQRRAHLAAEPRAGRGALWRGGDLARGGGYDAVLWPILAGGIVAAAGYWYACRRWRQEGSAAMTAKARHRARQRRRARLGAYRRALARSTQARLDPDIVCGTSIGAVIGAHLPVGALPDFAEFVRRHEPRAAQPVFRLQIRRRRHDRRQPRPQGYGRSSATPASRICRARSAALRPTSRRGDEVWLREGPLLDALRASYAIPGLFPPAQLGRRWLIDGALRQSGAGLARAARSAPT